MFYVKLYRSCTLGLCALFRGIDGYAAVALQYIETRLALTPVAKCLVSRQTSGGGACGHLLICGPRGVGKSTLARATCKSLTNSAASVYVNVIECKPLRGR